MGLYDNTHGNINWREQDLYGSSRIGMWTPNANLATGNALKAYDTTGKKQYELDNHLSNTMETISDVRIPNYIGGSHIEGTEYFTATVLSAQDYYPFGMLMPDRQYTNGDSTYRYGFNGKENDNEVKGLGNQQDYGERIYDDRTNRFFSVDPIFRQYPALTSYQFSSDNPILNIDIDGLEGQNSDHGNINALVGTTVVKKATDQVIKKQVVKQVLSKTVVDESGELVVEKGVETVSTGAGAVVGGVALAFVLVFAPTKNDPNSAEAQFEKHGGAESGIQKFVHPSQLTDQDIKDINDRLTRGVATAQDRQYVPHIRDRLNALNKSSGQSAGQIMNIYSNELVLSHSVSTIVNSSDYQKIKGLTNQQLIQSVLNNPDDPVTISSRTGKLLQGNTRVYELQRRNLNIDIPVAIQVSDNSYFDDDNNLKEPPPKK
jgi:RHS repeat-associated protein